MNIKEWPPLVWIVLVAVLGFGTFKFFTSKPNASDVRSPLDRVTTVDIPSNIDSTKIIKIAGSKSLVTINKTLAATLGQKGLVIKSEAGGSQEGIRLLKQGRIDIAASSFELKESGFESIPVGIDSIAFFSKEKISDISASELKTLLNSGRVLNSPVTSGTRSAIEKLLDIKIDASAPSVSVDALTGSQGVIQNLNGRIGYGSYALVRDQSTVSIIPIDGKLPGDDGYIFNRDLFYIIKSNAPAVVKEVVKAAQSL